MNGLPAYSVQVILCSALFTIYYWLLLRNKRLHDFNRWYILAATVLSLLLPLLKFRLPGIGLPADTPLYRLLEVSAGSGAEPVQEKSGVRCYSWKEITGLVYAAGVMIAALSLLLKLAWLYRLQRKSRRSAQQGYTLIHTTNEGAPFSFLHLLFWKDGTDLNSEEGQRMLRHELVHIRQRHTLDKLLLQLVLVFAWFNPFFRLLYKEQSLVHEFIADEGAIENRDTELFARMLLQEYCGQAYPDLTLPFFYSSTKRRLLMLHKQNKPRFAGARRLFALPLLGGALCLFSFKPGNTPPVQAQHTVKLALDAGHGGKDHGASGVGGTHEKELTLKLAQRLSQMAEAYNIQIIELRPADEAVKLADRTAKANAEGADLLLSVHLNAAPEQKGPPRHPGFDIFLMQDNKRAAESRELASAVAAQLQVLKVPAQLTDKRLALLRTAQMPAILVECGYMDRTADVARINDPVQLDALCAALLEGVVAYSNNRH